MRKRFRKMTAVLLMIALIIMTVPIGVITVNAAGYNPSAAVEYAGKYWNNYNPAYGNYNSVGGDCANFVSQCLYAGGIEQDGTWYNGSSAWISCSAQIEYFRNKGYTIIDGAQASDIKVGNPVYYYYGGSMAHTAICVGYDDNGTPLVAAHNTNFWRAEWTLGGASWWGGSTRRVTILMPETPNYVDLGTDFYAFIINTPTWKHLTVERDNNVVIRSEKSDLCADQVWKFEKQWDGSYKIISTANGECLDVDNASRESGTNVKTCVDNGNDAQRWYIYGSSGNYRLKSKCSDCVLDVVGGNSAEGTNVEMYAQNNTNAQIFQIWGLSARSFAANLGNDFTAPILNMKSWITLQNDENSNVSLQQETGIARDLWRFKRQSDGSYIICSCYDGKCFDLQNWSHENGANVQVYSETGCDAQRWYLYEYAGGYTIQSKESGKLLDVADGVLSVGSNIQVYAWNGSDAQIFSVYRGDECKLKAADLSVDVKENKQVEFTWNNVYGEKGFDIKIWNGKHWEGDAYTNIWALPANSTSATTELPPGKYEAYIDTFNNYDLLMSNVVSFEVLPQFLVSVYHKEHVLKCTWDKVLQAESYKIEIFDSNSNLVQSQENIKDLQYQTPISEGSYTVKLTSNNNLSVTKPLIVNYIEGKIGDVNLDGYINEDDAWFYVKALVRILALPNKRIADTNMDGQTNIDDIHPILQYVSGKEVENVGKVILLNMIGDTNLDGKLTVSDVTSIQRHLADLNTFNTEQLSVADTNGDGTITIDDATHLQLFLAEYDVELGEK